MQSKSKVLRNCWEIVPSAISFTTLYFSSTPWKFRSCLKSKWSQRPSKHIFALLPRRLPNKPDLLFVPQRAILIRSRRHVRLRLEGRSEGSAKAKQPSLSSLSTWLDFFVWGITEFPPWLSPPHSQPDHWHLCPWHPPLPHPSFCSRYAK